MLRFSGNLSGMTAPVVVQGDVTAPTFVSGQVADSAPDRIVITMSEALSGTLPAASAFTASGKTVLSVSGSGNVINITVDSPYTTGLGITISYLQPVLNPLSDTAGNQTLSFGPSIVSNNVGGAPYFTGGQIYASFPSIITVFMSEDLVGPAPPLSAFSVVTPNTKAILSVTTGVVASYINITVDSQFITGDVVAIAYTKPVSNPMRDAGGNETPSFGPVSILNRADTLPPEFISANVDNLLSTFDNEPTSPTYQETLYSNGKSTVIVIFTVGPDDVGFSNSAPIPLVTDFIVSNRTITAITDSNRAIYLTVNADFGPDDVITVQYIKPTVNALQDPSGNKTESFGPSPVLNNIGAAELESAFVDSVNNPSVFALTMTQDIVAPLPDVSAFSIETKVIASVTVGATPNKINVTVTHPYDYLDVNPRIRYLRPDVNPLTNAIGKQCVNFGWKTAAVPCRFGIAYVPNNARNTIKVCMTKLFVGTAPAPSCFTVSGKTVIGLSYISNDILLTLDASYGVGDIMTITYTKPVSNPLTDSQGYQLDSFGPFSVQNWCCEVKAPGTPFLACANFDSGPKNGNTDTSHGGSLGVDGLYVWIWGNYLGSTQGASTISIGGHAVARVIYWGPAIPPYSTADLSKSAGSNEFHDMQVIIAQISHLATDGLGEIRATVGGQTSNGLPFTIRPGRIMYMTDTGDNPTSDGTWQHPFANFVYFNDYMNQAGDVMYIKNVNREATFSVAGYMATPEAPMAMCVYPGSTSYLGADDSRALFLSFGGIYAVNWIVSGFHLNGDVTGLGLPPGCVGIGNYVTAGHITDSNDGAAGCSSEKCRFLCCEFNNIGFGGRHANLQIFASLYHVLYMSGGTRTSDLLNPPDSVRSAEVGWCYIHDNISNRALNVFNDNNSGWHGSGVKNIKFHHNAVVRQCGAGMGLLSLTAGDLWMYSNILSYCGLQNPQSTPLADPQGDLSFLEFTAVTVKSGYQEAIRRAETRVHFWNNTIYQGGWATGPTITTAQAVAAGVWGLAYRELHLLDMHNNLTYQVNGDPALGTGFFGSNGFTNGGYFGSPTTSVPAEWSHNGWYGSSDVPLWDTGRVTADPLIVSVGLIPDLHLQSGSPLRGVGLAISAPFDYRDFDGNQISGTPDIGALQYAAP